MNTEKTILINGSATPVAVEEALTFGSYLARLNQELAKQGQVVSAIKIAGREITEADETALKDIPLQTVIDQAGKLEIATMNPADLAYETLGTLDLYVDRLMLSVQRAADLYKQKNLLSGDTYFVKAIDGLDLFTQTIGGVKMALRVGLHPQISLIEAQLVSTMNELLSAKRENNYVFMAELLEKDLNENLAEWKNIAFPAMRTWKIS